MSAPLLILHLSDLHFGNHSRFAGQNMTALGKAFHKALVDAKRRLKIDPPVQLVIVTGDVAETAKPKEFDQGADFLKSLAGELGLEMRRFVFVPGNHDVSWPECLKIEAEQKEEEFGEGELRQKMDEVKFRRYKEFLQEYYGITNLSELPNYYALKKDAYLHDFPDLQVSVAALNSCEVESHRSRDHRGELSVEQAQALMDAWRAPKYNDYFKIVAVHHNPVVTTLDNIKSWSEAIRKNPNLDPGLIDRYESDIVGFEGWEHLQTIVKQDVVQLVLHGHHHAQDQQIWPSKGQGLAHVLSTGSFSLKAEQLPGDEPPSAQLILLSPDGTQPTLRANSLVYEGRFHLDGEILPGGFVPDPAQPDVYEKPLDLPPDFKKTEPRDSPAPSKGAEWRPFVRTYRQRLSSAYSRWDLRSAGVTQAGGVSRPIEADLDAMYLPLRLAIESSRWTQRASLFGLTEGFDLHLQNFDGERTLSPEDLLAMQRPLVIRGPAGAGKTTWVRWTFRRLLNLDQAFPIMIVLRELARRWQDPQCQGEARSLDAFLDDRVEAELGGGWKGYLRQLLASRDGPRPVLLVDGWDELGPLGEELRRKLVGFMTEHPRVLVVVTSRPYGEGRPSHSDGFDVILDLQPLSNDEIEDLARRFFSICYGEAEQTARDEANRLMKALERSPEALALARTALLLTMMLLISRSRPLPDKRHLLYEACIENLLNALPERRESEGVLISEDQWRPDDSEERMRIVAALAFRLQSEGYQKITRSAIIRTWEEMAGMLPERWPEWNKTRFLRWLAGPAGLLVERVDGTLAFAHLSFQEYLTAWHLNATVDGPDDRVKEFMNRLGYRNWWETLLLWAAMVGKLSQERLEPVLSELMRTSPGLSLAGMMLADGLGPESKHDGWTKKFLNVLSWHWPDGADRCLQAWSASRQEERKQALANRVPEQVQQAMWPGRLRLTISVKDATLPVALPPPRAGSLCAELEQYTLTSSIPTHRSLAACRVFCGANPVWPGEPEDLALLQLWPGQRRVAGLQLQFAAICGAERRDLSQAARASVRRLVEDQQFQNRARDWARYWDRDSGSIFALDWGNRARAWGRDFARAWVLDWALDWARYSAGDWARYWDRDRVRAWARDSARYWDRGWALDWARGSGSAIDWAGDWARDSARYWRRDWARYWARYSGRYSGRYSAGDWDRSLGRAWARAWFRHATAPLWFENFVQGELLSLGRACPRVFVAMQDLSAASPRVQILSTACRLSLDPTRDPANFEGVMANYAQNADPLWPALARHLARRSTEADRALLTNLAAHPEEREPPLSWGLRYIVRGDVLLDDGSVVTLDELADEQGMEHLPYLEEMPPELDVG